MTSAESPPKGEALTGRCPSTGPRCDQRGERGADARALRDYRLQRGRAVTSAERSVQGDVIHTLEGLQRGRAVTSAERSWSGIEDRIHGRAFNGAAL